MESSFNQTHNGYYAQTPETKVYTCSTFKLIMSIFFIWIFAFAFSASLSMLITTLHVSNGMISTKLLFVATVVPGLIISIIFTLIYAQLSLNKRIEINLSGITFYRSDNRYKHYPLNVKINSFVEWGVLTDSSRSILITLPNGKKYEESFRCFSKEIFASVMSDINNLQTYGEFYNRENIVSMRNDNPNSLQARFYIPKQQLYNNMKISGMTPLYIGIVTIISAVAIPYLLYFLDILSKQYMWVAVCFFLILIPIAIILSVKEEKNNLNNCPECIELYTNCIKLDNNIFSIYDIQKITMTPHSYRQTKNGMSMNRFLTIYMREEKKEYVLGRTYSPKSNQVFSDYKMLVSSVKSWCFDHNVNFFDDLG